MKTKLLLIVLAFGLMSSTCTPEEQPTNDCGCVKTFYERQQTGWSGASPVYTFVAVGSADVDCTDEITDYTLQGGNWVTVNCN